MRTRPVIGRIGSDVETRAAPLLLPGFAAIVRLHPVELSYYNALAGGAAGARQRDFETIYFASTCGSFLPPAALYARQ